MSNTGPLDERELADLVLTMTFSNPWDHDLDVELIARVAVALHFARRVAVIPADVAAWDEHWLAHYKYFLNRFVIPQLEVTGELFEIRNDIMESDLIQSRPGGDVTGSRYNPREPRSERGDEAKE